MEAVLLQQRIALAIAASAIGIAAAWVTKTPFGLLAPVAALFLFARGRATLLLQVALGIGLAASLLVAAFDTGAPHDHAVTGAAVFAVLLSVGTMVSVGVSASSRAQEALRNRERELSQLVEWVPAHIRRMTPQGEPTFFNKRLRDFYGLDVADMDRPGMSRLASVIETVVHPDDAGSLLELARGSFASGEPFSMRYRTRRADGLYRWVDTRTEPLRDEGGAISQWYAISLDIDDQMRAEQALRDRERELAQLVDMLPVNIRRVTPQGETIFFNKRLVDLLGMDLMELRKRGMNGLVGTLQTFVHPDDAANLHKAMRHALATGGGYAARY